MLQLAPVVRLEHGGRSGKPLESKDLIVDLLLSPLLQYKNVIPYCT